MAEMITSAAVEFHLQGGFVHLCTGARHAQIKDEFNSMRIRQGMRPVASSVEGFVTDQGRFLDRKEAMKLARENHQLKRQTDRVELNSEDLW